jgi:hypothetical protein
MAERDEDFDDLVDGGEQFANADEAADTDNTPEKQDDATSGADKGKTPIEGDGNDDEDGDEASKDEADADKDGKDADAGKDEAKEQKFVPKAALDSVKRKNRDLTNRLKRIEERLGAEDAEIARRAIPDPKSQPAEHAAYVARQTQAVQLNDRLNFSEYHARKAHGDDVVSEAFDWANARMEDPKGGEQFAKTLFAHADPYDYAVSLFNESKAAGPGVEDPEYEQFRAWKAAQAGEGNPVPAPNQQGKKAARPQSLAQQSSAAGPSGAKPSVDPFDAEFDR